MKPEIDKLVDQGILQCCKVSPNARYFENYIFPKIKENGKVRIIFDMKNLDRKLTFKTFKNMKLADLFPYLHSCSFACRLDLTSAYYHISIAESCKKFLAFKFENKIYMWNAMPFGLSEAPYLFSKLMECVVTNLRVKFNLIIMFYLDDIIILDHSLESCKKAVKLAIEFITSLGLTINFDKSVVSPVQVITFLGVKLDLINKTIAPSEENANKCILKTVNFLERSKANRTCFKSLIGTLNFSASFTWFGRNALKDLAKFNSIFRTPKWKHIPRVVKHLLKAWTEKEHYTDVPIPKTNPDVILFTDASAKGWGGMFVIGHLNIPINGIWDTTERKYTMNSLETLAILKALQKAPESIANGSIHILSDNTIAVASIRQGGSTRFQIRQKIVGKILKIMKERKITVTISHLKGSLNVSADALSRSSTSLPTEATLSEERYVTLCWNLGIEPQVDLFAIRGTRSADFFHT